MIATVKKSKVLMSVQEICEKIICGFERVCSRLSTNCDPAIECLGVRAIESLDVRVATILVRMMKRKVATCRFSSLGSAFPGLLVMLHRMVFAVLFRSWDYRNFVVLVLVEDL